MNTTQLLYWVKEREAIRIRRARGEPPPWTDDPILGVWSFCNVRREDDRVTRWIADNWRDPHAENPDLWFAIVVARFLNWPDTLAEIRFPLPWDPERTTGVLRSRRARSDQVWGAAYKVGTAGISIDKIDYLIRLLVPLWASRKRLRPMTDDSLLGWHARLKEYEGMADFMAAQVVADMKYVEPLKSARDWMTFAASGPGSRRGLNRVLGRPVDARWQEEDWRIAIRKLHEAVSPELTQIGLDRLHAQDLQNCLCELDKFERARLGEGKPKRRFVPAKGWP